MMIQNRSARPYWIQTLQDGIEVSTLVAPGDLVDVTDARGAAMIKAGTHNRRVAGVIMSAVHEIVEVKGAAEPMPASKFQERRGLADLPENVALDLVSKANLDSLDKLAVDEKRPEVLSAVLKRKRG
jgi:hypothetical protein